MCPDRAPDNVNESVTQRMDRLDAALKDVRRQTAKMTGDEERVVNSAASLEWISFESPRGASRHKASDLGSNLREEPNDDSAK